MLTSSPACHAGGEPTEASGEHRRTYDVGEAGRLLGIGRNAAYEAARRGDIPTIRLGRRLLVPKAALDRMLNGEGV
jgi:excisionase family DNA binding protein